MKWRNAWQWIDMGIFWWLNRWEVWTVNCLAENGGAFNEFRKPEFFWTNVKIGPRWLNFFPRKWAISTSSEGKSWREVVVLGVNWPANDQSHAVSLFEFAFHQKSFNVFSTEPIRIEFTKTSKATEIFVQKHLTVMNAHAKAITVAKTENKPSPIMQWTFHDVRRTERAFRVWLMEVAFIEFIIPKNDILAICWKAERHTYDHRECRIRSRLSQLRLWNYFRRRQTS